MDPNDVIVKKNWFIRSTEEKINDSYDFDFKKVF